MIQITGLHKHFGAHHVLKGIDLEVEAGTTRVILGLSGSGKTVLMKHIIGLMKPDQGTVEVDGEDIVPMGDRELLRVRRKFGMVFQQAALFDSMTVFENVAFPLREHEKLTEEEIAQRVHKRLEDVGLHQVDEKYPAELSGGMRKRVGLARAIIRDPQYILYDEPTTGLDPITTDNVDEMILHATRNLRVTSIVISHDIGSALNVADRIAVIHEGQIVEDTTPAELRKSQHPFVRRFLESWFKKQ